MKYSNLRIPSLCVAWRKKTDASCRAKHSKRGENRHSRVQPLRLRCRLALCSFKAFKPLHCGLLLPKLVKLSGLRCQFRSGLRGL